MDDIFGLKQVNKCPLLKNNNIHMNCQNLFKWSDCEVAKNLIICRRLITIFECNLIVSVSFLLGHLIRYAYAIVIIPEKWNVCHQSVLEFSGDGNLVETSCMRILVSLFSQIALLSTTKRWWSNDPYRDVVLW